MADDDKKKPHRPSKLKGKKDKGNLRKEDIDPKLRNPKAFAFNSLRRAERKFRRGQDVITKKQRVPTVDRTPVEQPPFVVSIVGPSKVGKSTLFQNLTRHFTRQTIENVKGPVTLVTGKKRRLTLIECNSDIHSMIDTAKVADLVLLLIDASFGFEMEVFEFLNICQVHGFPQIMGVLTHLDLFKNKEQLKKAKKNLKHRFWTEVYPGAKLFYLSGFHTLHSEYPKNEIHNLARFISVMKLRTTAWRAEHSYLVVDRLEDITSPEDCRKNPNVDRNLCLYGYVHGTFFKPEVPIHIPGLGDFLADSVIKLDDPCPLPMKERTLRRSLTEKEKVIYAPFSGVGGVVYDQDAVYIDLGGSHSHKKKLVQDTDATVVEKSSPFISELQQLRATVDEKLEFAGMRLFSKSNVITGAELETTKEIEDENQVQEDEEEADEASNINEAKKCEIVQVKDGRHRRKVIFDDEIAEKINSEIQELRKGDDSSGSSSDGEDYSFENIINPKSGDRVISNATEAYQNEASNVIDADDLVAKVKGRIQKQGGSLQQSEISLQREKSNEEINEVYNSKCSSGFENNETEDYDVDEDANHDSSADENGIDDFDNEEDIDEDGETEIIDSTSQLDNEDFLERCKNARYSEAEENFYSRFQKRSYQRMIYDDETEYLNVGPKADFDLSSLSEGKTIGKSSTIKWNQEKMKNLFVGGDYADTAQEILQDDEDLNGDFEVLDENKSDDDCTADAEFRDIDEQEKEKDDEKRRQEMKRKLKEKFDMDYDEGGNEEKTFLDEWKGQMEEQTKLNRSFFKDVEENGLLEELQGLQPGTYARVTLTGIPAEFVHNFEPQRACPLVIGSLDTSNQETLALIQARVKKHRWHPKILKSKDPLLLSMGWRRFQTVSIFSVHDHNMRNRMIKYTPEHLHCVANFYGPVTPQGTGLLGIAPEGFQGFRITLTGAVLDLDKSTQLVKKLKLIGTPAKIFKKSAFIQGMFNSELEVAKFTGAKLQTVSGIRGVIKKPLRTPIGAFRATFEDRILLSDIVFCRTWAKVEVPKFYLNLPNHVISKPPVLRTLGELKRENNIHSTPNPDNLYVPIERTPKVFPSLQIPKRLQERLPYKDKPKVQAKLNEPKRIAVVKEPKERKMNKLLGLMKSKVAEKEMREKEEKATRAAKLAKTNAKLEQQNLRRQKELRKKIFRTLGTMQKKNEARETRKEIRSAGKSKKRKQ